MELHIEIKGGAASGKSTIAKIISDALEKAGLAHEVDDGLDGDYGKWQTDKLNGLRKKTDFIVKIKTSTTLNRKATGTIPAIISPGECTPNSNPIIPDDIYKKINGQ